jgi:two-component system, OmpR family, flagellar system response regulator FtcR
MIILVEERTDVAEAYQSTIRREGFSVTTLCPEEFAQWFRSLMDSDLGALDALVLGEFEGREEAARSIKSRSAIPTIALNDVARLETTIRLFEAGVDDVVRKPIHAKEIIARIGAIRRRNSPKDVALWSSEGLVIFGDGRDPLVNGEKLVVPRRERQILEYLANNKGRRVSRGQIFAAVYGFFDEEVEECVIESHISKLRKKLRNQLGYDPIDTQRFLGYQLVARMAQAA